MAKETAFEGWVAHDKSAVEGKMVWEQYQPKDFTDNDIEIDVEACGICASDIHTLRSGWSESEYPLVTGHELAGTVTRVGSNIKHIKVGQRIGVGAQSDSCRECNQCKKGRESYCDNMTGTYNAKFLDKTGKSYGGYAKKWRGPGHFAVPIPDALPSHIAGPLMCGGITIFSPLQDYNVGKEGGKRVGIVGIGGIGAFGLAFAKALGAEQIVAISTSSSKKELAHKLGATDFVAMKEDPEAHKKFRRSLDVIITTANNEDQPYDKFAFMLRPRGHLINIALPEKPVMPIPVPALIFSGASIGGSAIGGIPQIADMLQVASKMDPDVFMIEKRSMKDANQAVKDMVDGKPRFRYALINDAA